MQGGFCTSACSRAGSPGPLLSSTVLSTVSTDEHLEVRASFTKHTAESLIHFVSPFHLTCSEAEGCSEQRALQTNPKVHHHLPAQLSTAYPKQPEPHRSFLALECSHPPPATATATYMQQELLLPGTMSYSMMYRPIKAAFLNKCCPCG